MRVVSVQNQLAYPLSFINLEALTADSRPLPVGTTYTFGGQQQGCDIPTLPDLALPSLILAGLLEQSSDGLSARPTLMRLPDSPSAFLCTIP